MFGPLWILLSRGQGRIKDFLKGGDLGAPDAHLRAPFMRAAHKGC